MNIFNDLFLLEQLDYLIRSKSTGSPAQLSSRLEICERHLYRLIGQLRDHGFPIEYNKSTGTYYYSAPVELRFDLVVNGKKLLSIKGGENYVRLSEPLTFLVREGGELCQVLRQREIPEPWIF